MANNIISVAIHDLMRTADGFTVALGQPQLKVTKTTQRVIDDLYDLYSRRASKSHGKFSDNQDNYPTQKHVREYVETGFGDFAELTAKMMATLQNQAKHKGAATGGHVFFSHFERDDRHYVLVAIITDKLGAALTKDLDVMDVKHLDMEGFRFAGRINITGWTNNEDRYIGFLKGKGDVSEYFKEFLGCDTTIQDRKDTSDLVVILKRFADDQGMAGVEKDDFLGRAKSICDRAAVKREEIEFEALANELMPRDPKALLDELTNPERRLNDRFVPDRRALRSLVKFRARTSLWSVEFERDALSQGKIVYDPADNSLTIKDLPPELTAELRAEQAGDA